MTQFSPTNVGARLVTPAENPADNAAGVTSDAPTS